MDVTCSVGICPHVFEALIIFSIFDERLSTMANQRCLQFYSTVLKASHFLNFSTNVGVFDNTSKQNVHNSTWV